MMACFPFLLLRHLLNDSEMEPVVRIITGISIITIIIMIIISLYISPYGQRQDVTHTHMYICIYVHTHIYIHTQWTNGFKFCVLQHRLCFLLHGSHCTDGAKQVIKSSVH